MYSNKLDALLKKSAGQKLKVIDPTDLEIKISEIPAAAPVAAPAPPAPAPAVAPDRKSTRLNSSH